MDIIDRFSTTLASGYTAGGTSLTLNSNVGLPSGFCDFYLLILAEGSNTEEVFHVTSMSGVAATVAGAQANTTASNHASGAQVIASIWTKAAFQALDVRNTTQAAGKVFAGPGSGSPATPVFRSLVAADLPNPGASALGGVQSKASASHQFLTQIGTDGVVAAAQPADTDISFTDNTTGNVSTTKHGYTPKLPNDAAKFLDGTGSYSTPAGGGTVTHSAGALTSNAPVLGNGSGDIKVGTTAQLVPSLPSDATKFLDGTGAWSVPAGGGGGSLPLWLQHHPDAYPASPNAMDDEFDAGAVNTSLWTAVNAAGAMVFTQSGGRLIATPTSDNGGAFRGYYQPLPGSGAWEFRTKLYFDPSSQFDTNVAGIMFYESGSGKADVLYLGRAGSGAYVLKLQKWTGSGASFGSGILASTLSGSPITPVYLSVAFDGSSNYTVKASGSGVAYFFLVATTTGDFTTKADRIALVYFSNQSGVADPAYWEFFRRTL